MQTPTIDAPHQAKSLSIQPLTLSDLWRNRRLMLLAVALFVGVGACYLAVAPDTYEAKARILVQQEGLKFDPTEQSRKDREFLATQAEIIRSPLTVSRALQMVNITLPPGVKKDPVTYVVGELVVTPMADTDVLMIEYRSHIPGEASQLISAVIESYQKVIKETSRDDFTETITVLQRAEEKVRTDLQSLQQRYVQLRNSSPLVGRGHENGDIDTARIRELSTRLNEARTRRIALEERQKQVSMIVQQATQVEVATNGSKAIRVAGNVEASIMRLLREEDVEAAKDLGEVQTQLLIAEANVAEIAKSYGPKHPEYRAAAAKMSVWEKLYSERLARLGDVLEQEITIARSLEVQLGKLYESERQTVQKMDILLTKEQLLLSNIQRVERLHDVSIERLSEFRIADETLKKGRSAVLVQTLEGPETTEEHVWPLTGPLLGVCGIIGLIVGLLLVSLLPGGLRQSAVAVQA